ncbi:hypothetical protein ACFIJ5_04240 [Haloimpatiens sp. FM7330]|uniref:hypothetical protein n=1 Tax=Haloimpatiens sp. FM7330 TaxID=3298610 RepID=UPI00363FA222
MKGCIIFSVFNKYELPIDNVYIYLKNEKFKFKGKTNNCGIVNFFNIPFGKYVLKIKRPQYKGYNGIVNICKYTTIINIKLKYFGKSNIYGKILDQKTEEPIEYATVVLYAKEANIIPVDYTITDKIGNYIFHNVPPRCIPYKSNKIDYKV